MSAARGASRDLSPREVEILRLIAQGYTRLDVATRLYVTLSTIHTHSQRIYSALGARNRAHAIAIAYQRGILGEGDAA